MLPNKQKVSSGAAKSKENQIFYDKFASKWDNESGTDYGKFYTAARIGVIKEFTDIHSKKILDLGCGSGNLTKLLVKESKVVGSDISKQMLRLAGKKVKIPLLLNSAEFLPFKENTFDVVLCIEVLEHCPNINTAIAEIFRVLKPDGKLIFNNLNLINPRNFARFVVMRRVYPDFLMLFPWRLNNSLRRAGFINMRAKYIVFSPLKQYFRFHRINKICESVPLLNKIGAVLFMSAEKAQGE